MDTSKYGRIRELLHQHPELSGHEEYTSLTIRQILQTFSPHAIHSGIGGYGIIAEYNFSCDGPTLLFRADMDAVAVHEDLPLPYVSQCRGIAHKCGHDGHTAILLALAGMLHENPLSRGHILLLFQPAEETGQGAQAVLQDPFFRHNRVDYAFALHNLPGVPLNTIVCRTGSFTCAVISCTITLQGHTAHAAEPEKALSPTPALLEIWKTAESWDNNQPATEDYFRSTLIELHIGQKAYGVAAGSGLIRLTLRAAQQTTLDNRIHILENLVEKLTKNTGLAARIEWLEAFTANNNDPHCTTFIREAATANRLNYVETDHPFAWGEDFGLFTQHYPGAMFGLGAGLSTPPLHSPEYDFPNEIIPAGASMFYKLIDLTSR